MVFIAKTSDIGFILMNKGQLVEHIAESAGISKKEALAALDALTSTVTSQLAKGGDVTLVGFGTFGVKKRAARIGRNPRTGAELKIAAATLPAFKAGASLKKAVNN